MLTSGQERAVKIALERYRMHCPYTVISGYAGTGKTTCVQYIIDALGVTQADVVYIAFTGKASLVLKNKGCKNAMTAHKFLYNAERNENGEFDYTPKDIGSYKYKVIVLDECSMLPNDMWELLLEHKIYIIALGDHGQLPPVNAENKILEKPHVILEEIVRQALDNPIIRLSMDIRTGHRLEYGGDKFCRVVKPSVVSQKLLLGADQVLCGKNKTRKALNQRMRKLKWGDMYTRTPVNGDKIICLRNYWRSLSTTREPLLNGMIGKVADIDAIETKHKLFSPVEMYISFDTESDGMFQDIRADYKIFAEGEPTITKNNWRSYRGVNLHEFDYGDAITVHKAQGSEFDRVLVFDEWIGDKETHRKWLYTAATRASKQLIIVR